MSDINSTDGLARLERSCAPAGTRRDWFHVAPGADGFLRVEADLKDFRYAPHRHDTYAIGLTLAGVQSFNYRRMRRDCLPGHAIVLHPDEIHDGQAGSESGFRYRMIYLEPADIRSALAGHAHALPLLQGGHGDDARLRDAVLAALADFENPVDDLERAGMVQAIADALLLLDPQAAKKPLTHSSGISRAVERARELLHAEVAVSATQIEAATGISRFELARRFRQAFGTSPHRYHQMRRLDRVRIALSTGTGIAAAAHQCGFADQSHLTRQFTQAFGLSPGRWLTMVKEGRMAGNGFPLSA